MDEPILLTLPAHIYQQAKELAQRRQEPIERVLVESLDIVFPNWPVHPQRAQMRREEAAFDAMRPKLLATYPGEFVALQNGQVVDHDANELALLQRMQAQSPEQLVLIREVTPTPPPPLHFRSPRFRRGM